MMPDGTPEEQFPNLFGVGTESLVRNASRLGLTWRIRLGTVTTGGVPNFMLVRLDGDVSDLTVVSIIGSRVAGTRVYVLTVPPAGNFAIGQVDAFTPEPTPTRIATSIETADSAGFTAETQIGSVTGDLVAGRTYRVRSNAQVGSTVVNDTALVRLREDTISGTLMGLNTGDIHTTGNIPTICFMEAEYTPAADETKTFIVSAQRLSGTGNIRREAVSPGWPQLTYIEYVSG